MEYIKNTHAERPYRILRIRKWLLPPKNHRFSLQLSINGPLRYAARSRVAGGLLDVRAGGCADEVDYTMKPHGVQLSRKKGWRMPPNTIRVTRPGPWGNPFRVGVDGDAAECVAKFRERAMDMANTIRLRLRGKNLACCCPLGAPCHRNVLLEIANS